MVSVHRDSREGICSAPPVILDHRDLSGLAGPGESAVLLRGRNILEITGERELRLGEGVGGRHPVQARLRDDLVVIGVDHFIGKHQHLVIGRGELDVTEHTLIDQHDAVERDVGDVADVIAVAIDEV